MKGGISASNPPQTFKDAMAVARNLGLQSVNIFPRHHTKLGRRFETGVCQYGHNLSPLSMQHRRRAGTDCEAALFP